MLAFRIALARLRALFRRDSTADEIREELNFHVAMRADEYAREGLDAAAARHAALRRFGNVAVIQDRGYDVRGGGVMETILQDVKYSLRQLGQAAVLRHPGRADARARHRRVHRALQRHRRGAAAAAPLSAPRAARHHRRRRNQQGRQDVALRAFHGRYPHLANALDDDHPCRHGTHPERFRAADRRQWRRRPFDGRRSVRRLSRDLRRHAHPWPGHSPGRHAPGRSGGRPARARVLAARLRGRSRCARAEHPHPGPAHHDHRRPPGRFLHRHRSLAGQAVQRRHARAARHRARR